MHAVSAAFTPSETLSPKRLARRLETATSMWMVVLAIITMGIFSAPAQAASSKTSAEPVTQVYFIRGFLGVFSTGFDAMAKDLEKSGIRAEVYSHLSGATITSRIVSDYGQSQKRRKKLVLIGHSFGGNAALAVANRLRQKNITVDLVITVDPTRSGPVATNVQRYVNYYFPGNGLGAKLSAKTVPAKRITNIDMRKRTDIAGEGDDHWTVTNNAAIKKEIITAIRRTVR